MPGLFDKKSHWIWTKEDYNCRKPTFVRFRKVLEMDAPARGVFKVSADSVFRFYINGEFIFRGPCKGDDKVWYYEEAEVELRAGKNIFCAEVLRYPAGWRDNPSVWRTVFPGFYMEAKLYPAENDLNNCSETMSIYSDETWRSRVDSNKALVGKGMDFLALGEQVRGDAAMDFWLEEDFDDTAWAPVEAALEFSINKAVSPAGLSPRPVPAMQSMSGRFSQVVCTRTPVHSAVDWNRLIRGEVLVIPPYSHEIVELGVPAETTAYVNFSFCGGREARVKFVTAESYAYKSTNPMRPFPTKGNRTDYKNGFIEGRTDTYIVGGFGTEDQPERYQTFFYRAFRFAQLSVDTGEEPLIIHSLDFEETGYPMEVRTCCEASDPDFAAIWEISLRALRLCTQDTFMDCPFYEQLQYLQDSRLEALFMYQVSADDRMARRAMADFARSQRADGLLNGSYPSVDSIIIPNFSLFFIGMVHDHMMYFGDRELVRGYIPVIMRILDFFQKRQQTDGMLTPTSSGGMGRPYWSYIDWCPEWDGGVPTAIRNGSLTIDSLMVCYGCRMAAELAEYAGYNDIAASWRLFGKSLSKAVLTLCRGKEGMLSDGPGSIYYSQHVQVYAVLTQTLTGEAAKTAMLSAIREPGVAKCNISSAWYFCRALEMTDLYEYTESMWNDWRDMLKNNCSTCVESADISPRSDCHAWSSLLLYELPAVILGVRPTAPGFEAYEVRPVPGYLQWAKGKVITPIGEIHVCWKRNSDGTLALDVTEVADES